MTGCHLIPLADLTVDALRCSSQKRRRKVPNEYCLYTSGVFSAIMALKSPSRLGQTFIPLSFVDLIIFFFIREIFLRKTFCHAISVCSFLFFWGVVKWACVVNLLGEITVFLLLCLSKPKRRRRCDVHGRQQRLLVPLINIWQLWSLIAANTCFFWTWNGECSSRRASGLPLAARRSCLLLLHISTIP